MNTPWKQFVDISIVIIVMADTIETLDVALHSPTEEPGVHRLVLANRHVRQVRDGVELVILQQVNQGNIS